MPWRYPGPKPKIDDEGRFEDLWDVLVDALMDVPIRILVGIIGIVPVVGQSIANALGEWLLETNETAVDAQESVVSVGTQVSYMQTVIAVQSGMGVWETGPDRTGTPSFPFAYLAPYLHTHTIYGRTGSTDTHTHSEGSLALLPASIPTVAATASYAPWANVIFKSAAERKVLTWIAYKTGTVTAFHLDLYKLEADGTSTFTGYSSPNLAGEIPASLASIGWMQHLMSNASIVADVGDAYEVQFRVVGSGTVFLAGINFPYPTPLPGFRPYSSGAGRNPSTTPVPSSIPTVTRDSMYTGPCVFLSIGIDVGQTQIPRFFFDDFNRSSLGARWVTYGSSIGIKDNKVEFTGSAIANTTAAAMYHQPLGSDIVEVGADLSLDSEIVGFGICCTSGLGAGLWLVVREGGLWLDSGPYNSRTQRAAYGVPPGSGRYTVRRSLNNANVPVFEVYFGDAKAEDATPILTWPDTTGAISVGTGRRWVGVLARRNGLINPSGRLDNFTAADITITEQEPTDG